MSLWSKPSGLPSDSTLVSKMADNPSIRDSDVEVIEIHKSFLRPNPDQPRKTFPEERIEEKCQQLVNDGQQTPITVYPGVPNGEGQYLYTLVDGECRWRAAMRTDKIEYLRAQIYKGNPDDAYSLLISQLLHNDDGAIPLTNLERGVAYKKLFIEKQNNGSESPLTEISKSLGKAESLISELMSLADMSEQLVEYSLNKGISDTRVLSSMTRVEKLGGEEIVVTMLSDIDTAIEQGNNLREAVKKHVEIAKTAKYENSKKKKGTKKKGADKKAASKNNKPKHRFKAKTVTLNSESNGQKVITVETTSKVYQIVLTADQLAGLV